MKTSMLAVCVSSCLLHAAAQATRSAIDPLLKQPLQSQVLVAEELRQFLLKRVPELPTVSSPADWQKEADRLREHELAVIYHGWPREWVEAKPNFEKVAEITRPGYRIVKLRYEIVPGFTSTALGWLSAAVRVRASAKIAASLQPPVPGSAVAA